MSIDGELRGSSVPQVRARTLNAEPVRAKADFVLYWMIAARRTRSNFALQRAVDWAKELGKPLVVFEPLRCGYQWASDRLHAFVIEGMVANAKLLAGKSVTYFPYLEPENGAGSGLLAALARHACLIVTDDYPCFFLPRMTAAAAKKCGVRMESIDSNGLLPMRAADKVFARAYDFRRFLQKNLRQHLQEFPKLDPLRGVKLPQLDELPKAISKRWPSAALDEFSVVSNPAFSVSPQLEALLAKLPLDHKVAPAMFRGGSAAAASTLKDFLDANFSSYGESRNHPDEPVTSGLSPYLHFGHISAHGVVQRVFELEGWKPAADDKKLGQKRLWDEVSENADAFLDELVTWRELGFNMCSKVENYDSFESLPDWAQATLADHADDEREFVYSLEEFAAAQTHDEIWNAAQRQLVLEGRMHNYMRMLWGKKILEWTQSPRDALAVMIELNNKYAVDGRDPNSYSGIFWILGRYDRAWGPEREIFGKIRYMSCDSTRRKLKLKQYLEKFGEQQSLF